jgi:hypothetical protein
MDFFISLKEQGYASAINLASFSHFIVSCHVLLRRLP